jgi:hypothetical protein
VGRRIARPCRSAPNFGLSSRRAAIVVLEGTSEAFSTGDRTVFVGLVATFLGQQPREDTGSTNDSCRARPHQCLGQAIPVAESRSVAEAGGKVVLSLILDGLHHDYRSAA